MREVESTKWMVEFRAPWGTSREEVGPFDTQLGAEAYARGALQKEGCPWARARVYRELTPQ